MSQASKFSNILSTCSVIIALLALWISYSSFRTSQRISYLWEVENCWNCQAIRGPIKVNQDTTVLWIECKVTNLGTKTFSIEKIGSFSIPKTQEAEKELQEHLQYGYSFPDISLGVFSDIDQNQKLNIPIVVEPGYQKKFFVKIKVDIPFDKYMEIRSLQKRRLRWDTSPQTGLTKLIVDTEVHNKLDQLISRYEWENRPAVIVKVAGEESSRIQRPLLF